MIVSNSVFSETSFDSMFDIDVDKALNEYHESMKQQVTSIVEQYLRQGVNISYQCASDIWYIRSRSRGYFDMEKEIISQHLQGNKLNMGEFGTSPAYPY